MFGLTDQEIQQLKVYLAAIPEIKRAWIYGSRAKGNYKAFSDVDLTLEGVALTRRHLLRLATQLHDSSLPYQFDLSLYDTLKNPDLLSHIGRCGRIIYDK